METKGTTGERTWRRIRGYYASTAEGRYVSTLSEAKRSAFESEEMGTDVAVLYDGNANSYVICRAEYLSRVPYLTNLVGVGYWNPFWSKLKEAFGKAGRQVDEWKETLGERVGYARRWFREKEEAVGRRYEEHLRKEVEKGKKRQKQVEELEALRIGRKKTSLRLLPKIDKAELERIRRRTQIVRLERQLARLPGRREVLGRQIRAYREPIRKFAETYPTPKEMLTYVRQPPRQLIPWQSILGTPAPYRPALPTKPSPVRKRPTKRIPPTARQPTAPSVLSGVDRQVRDTLRDIWGGRR